MTEPTPHPSSTSSDPDLVEGTLAVAPDDHHTLYVLPGDVLLMPCSNESMPAAVAAGMKDVHDHLELQELVVTPGVREPWVIRKATQPE